MPYIHKPNFQVVNCIDDFPTCILCTKKYDPDTDRGLMNCRVHPLEENIVCNGKKFPKYHRECCGATTDKSDFSHYEYSTPAGCLAIDHVSSVQELRDHLAEPYFVVRESDAEDLVVFNRILKPKQQWVIKISSIEMLDKDLQFNIFNGNPLSISLRDIHLQLKGREEREASTERVAIQRNSRLYYVYRQDNRLNADESEFTPFYIIRRCDYRQDILKLKEIDYGRTPCKFKCKLR